MGSDQSRTFYTYETFNEKMKGDNLEVLLKDSTKSLIKDLKAGPDSVTWYNIEKSEWQSVATVDISYIEKSNRFAGAIEGFFIGAATGVGATLPFTLLGKGKTDGGLGAFYCGLGGATLGLLIGVGNGHTSAYEFVPDSTQSVK